MNAFRRHLDDAHPEKWEANHEETNWFLEELIHSKRGSCEESTVSCCWSGCDWKIEFETDIDPAGVRDPEADSGESAGSSEAAPGSDH